MAAKEPVRKLLDEVGKFVTANNGAWNHGDWETLVAALGAMGAPTDDQSRRRLGDLLESCKYFHTVMPGPAPKKPSAAKKTAAKKKAAAKKKSPAKKGAAKKRP